MKKAYYWSLFDDDDSTLIVIADDRKEAIKMGWDYSVAEFFDGEYINIRCSRIKHDVKIDDLPYGVCNDDKILLTRGLVSSIFYCDCETCDYNGMISDVVDGKLMCEDCVEKFLEKKK